jgi:uncharacterized protein
MEYWGLELEAFGNRPAEMELERAPIPRDWILAGNPQAREKELARSSGGATRVVVWSCTKGSFRWQYLVDEMVHILSGEAFIADHAGTTRRLGPGDVALFPAGSWAVWRVTEDIRKVAVLNARLPAMLCKFTYGWNRIYRAVRVRLGLDARLEAHKAAERSLH